MVDCVINGFKTKCLVDTRADNSIINTALLKPMQSYNKNERLSLRTACGGFLNTIGTLANTNLHIFSIHTYFKTNITEGGPPYAILGVDVIRKHPEILVQILKNNSMYEKVRNKQVNNVMNLGKDLESKYQYLFQDNLEKNVLCKAGYHTIHVEEGPPIAHRNGRIPVHFEEEIEKEVQKLLQNGVIRHSKSDWCNRIIPIRKKDGSLRMCLYFRPLNAIRILDRYPIPRID